MSDIVYVGRKIRSFDTSAQFDGYTKVVITVSDELEYMAGVDTGRTLTLNCPWGTQDMADNILNSIQGFKYQPYTADSAIIDPAAELGDGITVNDVYSGIYSMKTTFGAVFRSKIAAPAEQELDHEYPYAVKQERRIIRQMNRLSSELRVQGGLISAEVAERKSIVDSLSARLSVQAGLIDAKVSRFGGEASSFGWQLDDSSWTIKSNGADVLRATRDGLDICGRIMATGGRIGGFDIMDSYLSYNGQTWGGTNTFGAYLGINGLQLGQRFKVDIAGNLYAASGTFEGNVRAGSILYGENAGTLNGLAITPRSISGGSNGGIALNSLSTANLTGGINTSLGYADFANGVFNGYSEAQFLKCLRVQCSGAMSAARLTLGGRDVALEKATVVTPDGETVTIRYLNWSY